jgi:hypothetical protein
MDKADLMFTGIVTDIGKVAATTELPQGVRLRIDTAYDPRSIDIGASISCAGVCLTVVPAGIQIKRALVRGGGLGGGASPDDWRHPGAKASASILSAH